MKLQYCLTILLCLYFKGDAQTKLSMGDRVPNVEIKSIFNYSASKSNISVFTNKLLILDFMATNCSSCLKVLPRFDSLQKQYGNKIQIVLVSNQPSEKVKNFLKLHPIPFPFIAEDTLLNQLFPHTFISHEVWIKDGVVKAITHTEYVNSKNIASVLSGANVNWPVKNDLAPYDYSKPLLNGSGYYSVVTPAIESVASKYSITPDSILQTVKVSVINFSIIDLYLRSYGIFKLAPSHIILEVKDTNRFVQSPKVYKAEWKLKNTFCYEAVSPLSISLPEREAKLRSDLDYYFGVHGRMEKRKIASYILLPTDPIAVQDTFHGGKEMTVANLVYNLNQNYGTPFIDEGKFPQKIFVHDEALKNISLLQDELKRYGLKLVLQQRETNVLVISETNLNPN